MTWYLSQSTHKFHLFSSIKVTKTDLLLPFWAKTSISTQTQMITSSRYMLIVETAMTHGDISHSKKPELVLVRLELFLAVALVLFVTKVGLLSKEGRRRYYIFFLSWREWLDGKMSNTRQHPWDKNDRFPQVLLVMRRRVKVENICNLFHLLKTGLLWNTLRKWKLFFTLSLHCQYLFEA